MKLKDYAEKLQPFVFHGIDCNPATSGNAQADCPICHKEGKLGITVSTGQARCVICETSGNAYSFLEIYHRICFESTTEQQYEELAHARGLTSTRGLKAFGFARSHLKDEWMLPSYNEKNKMANLFRVFEEIVEVTEPLVKVGSQGATITRRVTKYQPASTPTFKLHPMGTRTLTKDQKRRRICEGPWDGVALYDFLSMHTLRGTRYVRTANPDSSLLKSNGVWSAPAAGNFQADWLYLLDGYDNDILFDNDHPKVYPPEHPLAGRYILQDGMCLRPGYNGELRVLNLLEESRNVRPESVRYLVWGPGCPSPENPPPPGYTPQISSPGHDPNLADGYDVRDAIKDQGIGVLDFLEPRLQTWTRPSRTRRKSTETDTSGGKIKPINRTSFAEVCEDFDTRLHYSKPMRQTFAVMLAVVISTELPEDPIWFRIIGPPGSGKTTLAECLSVAREWIVPKSIMTGLVSGYTDPSDREKDVSPLVEMNGKTVIMKDADTLVKSPKRDVILSQLRDIYDRAIRTSYLTGKGKDYEEINLTFILCGTDALRGLSRDTYLGERFLDCEIMDETIDHNPILRRAQSNAQSSFVRYFHQPTNSEDTLPDHEVHSDDNATFLKQSTYGLVKYYKDNFRSLPCPEFTESSNQRILALAGFLSFMRARVEKARAGNEQDYKPRAEIAGRLVKQFTKLSFCLAIVLGKTTVDDEVMDLCNKVMLDTAKGFQLDISLLLLSHPDGLSVQQIYTELNMAETSARHWITCMQELKIIHRSTTGNRSGQRGRDLHLWKMNPGIISLWQQSQGIPVTLNGHRQSRPSRTPRKAKT